MYIIKEKRMAVYHICIHRAAHNCIRMVPKFLQNSITSLGVPSQQFSSSTNSINTKIGRWLLAGGRKEFKDRIDEKLCP